MNFSHCRKRITVSSTVSTTDRWSRPRKQGYYLENNKAVPFVTPAYDLCIRGVFKHPNGKRLISKTSRACATKEISKGPITTISTDGRTCKVFAPSGTKRELAIASRYNLQMHHLQSHWNFQSTSSSWSRASLERPPCLLTGRSRHARTDKGPKTIRAKGNAITESLDGQRELDSGSRVLV